MQYLRRWNVKLQPPQDLDAKSKIQDPKSNFVLLNVWPLMSPRSDAICKNNKFHVSPETSNVFNFLHPLFAHSTATQTSKNTQQNQTTNKNQSEKTADKDSSLRIFRTLELWTIQLFCAHIVHFFAAWRWKRSSPSRMLVSRFVSFTPHYWNCFDCHLAVGGYSMGTFST